MATETAYIASLIEADQDISLEDFFHEMHRRFFPEQDLAFMEFFLQIVDHDEELVVEHQKLIEYGALAPNDTFNLQRMLDEFLFDKDTDYSVQVIRTACPQGGFSDRKQYMLTPDTFKICLMSVYRKCGDIDPDKYARYFLHLEDVVMRYIGYQRGIAKARIEARLQLIAEQEQTLADNDMRLATMAPIYDDDGCSDSDDYSE